MATEQTPSEFDEPIPDRDDVTKAKRLWYLHRLAHESAQLRHIEKQRKRVLDLADAARTGKVSDISGLKEEKGEEEMNIGNEEHVHNVTNNYLPPAEPSVASPASTGSSLAKTAGTALLAAALPIGGIAGYALNAYFTPEPAPVEQKEPVFDIQVLTEPGPDASFPAPPSDPYKVK